MDNEQIRATVMGLDPGERESALLGLVIGSGREYGEVAILARTFGTEGSTTADARRIAARYFQGHPWKNSLRRRDGIEKLLTADDPFEPILPEGTTSGLTTYYFTLMCLLKEHAFPVQERNRDGRQ